jgi:hypothetical protein
MAEQRPFFSSTEFFYSSCIAASRTGKDQRQNREMLHGIPGELSMTGSGREGIFVGVN